MALHHTSRMQDRNHQYGFAGVQGTAPAIQSGFEFWYSTSSPSAPFSVDASGMMLDIQTFGIGFEDTTYFQNYGTSPPPTPTAAAPMAFRADSLRVLPMESSASLICRARLLHSHQHSTTGVFSAMRRLNSRTLHLWKRPGRKQIAGTPL